MKGWEEGLLSRSQRQGEPQGKGHLTGVVPDCSDFMRRELGSEHTNVTLLLSSHLSSGLSIDQTQLEVRGQESLESSALSQTPRRQSSGEGWEGCKRAVVETQHTRNTEGHQTYLLDSAESLVVTILCIHRKQPLLFPSSHVPFIACVAFFWVLLLPLVKFKIWLGILKENQMNRNM